MKKRIVSIILILACFGMVGCNEERESVNTSSYKKVLEQISVPDMSTSILSSSETEQLKWLSEIYDFEINTLRSKTSGLSEADLQAVRSHLSQLFGVELVELLIDGFYEYNEEDKSYYVPNGSWFTYNDRWSNSNLIITDRSEEIVTLKLTGIDPYGDIEREIDHSFKIFNGRLLLEKRSFFN